MLTFHTVVPETSNLTLEQIDLLFKDNSGGEEAVVKAEVAQDIRLASVG